MRACTQRSLLSSWRSVPSRPPPQPPPAPAARKPLVCGGKEVAHVAAPERRSGDAPRRAAGARVSGRASQAWTQQHKLLRLSRAGGDRRGVRRRQAPPLRRAGARRRRHGQGAADGRHRGRRDDRRGVRGPGVGALRPVDRRPAHAASCSSTPRSSSTLQQQDGSIPDDDARLPVTGGVMHTTYQAMQTWRQAYARTADDKWLAPIRKAERYLAAQSAQWNGKSDVYIQNINFALLGLVAAGVGPSEESALRLQKLLLARQNQDGGWGLDRQDERRAGHRADALRAEARRSHRRRIGHRARLALAGEQAGRATDRGARCAAGRAAPRRPRACGRCWAWSPPTS